MSVYIESGDSNNSVSINNGSAVEIKEKNSSSSASISAEIKEETVSNFSLVEFIKKQFDSILNIFLN